MGWTNSVPIFHDDIIFILKDEIPHVTWPYIDDVPIRGPPHRYELPDGGYEVIPEDPGIRRFVWEHLQNVNRVLQSIKYAGGTFSGKKSVVCADEIVVVGYRLDTSWMAVGFGIFQEAPDNPKQCTCAKLGSIPGVGPHATIMRWIEDVLLYHFTLRHVPGKTFSVDGLSRRLKQPGDEEYPPINPELVDNPKTMHFEYPDKTNNEPGWEDWEPLALEEFADQIDTRGGYLHAVATEVSDFEQELDSARSQEMELRKAVLSWQQPSKIDPVAVLSLSQPLLPTEGTEEEKEADLQAYLKHRKGGESEQWDNLLPIVQSYLQDPSKEPEGLKGWEPDKFANGKIERPHWDVRQALFKACENCTKWFWFFFHVMWSDCITIWQRFGCSPYFMVTGAHPTLPLDLVEATWLIELPEGPLSTEEFIGYCARALAKHHQHVEEMRERVGKDKLQWALKFAEEHKNSIKDFNFKPLDLVLVKNMITESSHSAKMLPCFHGPMVVIAKTKGGNDIVAELDGSVWQTRVVAFRVVPYKAQRQLELSQSLEQ
ncbi:hypothetical protein J132_00972 [Termitomyces sp. J132]|nr:hypothetical protein J132_00972 [Termitomyces sp. J132]